MLKLDKNKKYLLACSCGPDSMALFGMLLEQGYKFAVAHVNYHFREKSSHEEKVLTDFCKKNNIKYHVLQNTEIIHKNLEARARDIRYSYFHKIVSNFGYDALLVAHHQDDSIETYIMQKSRHLKVFVYGLDTFSDIYDIKVIRPLLDYTKIELVKYCEKNHIPYEMDESNLSDDYLRNRIRHEIIDNLDTKTRHKYLLNMVKDNEYVNSILRKLSSIIFDEVEVAKTLNNDELTYALYLLAERQNIHSLSQGAIKEIDAVIKGNKPNVYIEFKNCLFFKEYGRIGFFNIEESNGTYVFEIDKPQELDTPYFYMNFTNGAENRNVHKSDYPITIRTALPDDVVQIKGYNKKVRRLFIDWKVPARMRKRYPIILNKNGKLIYIPRYSSDYIVKETDNFYIKCI